MKPIIVALDVEMAQQGLALAKRLRPYVDLFKVGPVLFLKYGGTFLEDLRALGAEVFLDLKLHDIPSVVAKAVERIGAWGVYSATLHAAGGAAMMKEAAAVRRRPRLWGVTVLTSLDQKDLRRMGVTGSVSRQVERLARGAAEAGLDGVIASVHEARQVKKLCGPRFQVVTPGIRLTLGGDDQKRTQTPSRAIKEGADFFVIGRPVVEAKDPAAVVRQISESLL